MNCKCGREIYVCRKETLVSDYKKISELEEEYKQVIEEGGNDGDYSESMFSILDACEIDCDSEYFLKCKCGNPTIGEEQMELLKTILNTCRGNINFVTGNE